MPPDLLTPANITLLCYTLIITGRATLHELQTVYSLEDAYDLIEVENVRAFNERVLSQRSE